MGTGIAEAAASHGLTITLVTARGTNPAPARERIAKSFERAVARNKMTAEAAEAALARITFSADRDALIGCDVVVESVVEDLAIKRALFEDLAARLGEETILASNTSTLRVADLAPDAARKRTIGLHFFSPVPAMRLVELAHLPETDPDVIARASALVEAMGKTAVPVVDSTGFVVNRLLVPYLVGAIAAYGQGLATADQIDTAMKLGCGHPVGPLMLADLVGLDVVYAMAKLLYKDFKDDRYRPPSLLRRMVQDGLLGKKSGRGFYDHSVRPAVPNQEVWDLVTSGHRVLHEDVAA
jgi:3-hydroxybutyryl-CoA dehydrogenase